MAEKCKFDETQTVGYMLEKTTRCKECILECENRGKTREMFTIQISLCEYGLLDAILMMEELYLRDKTAPWKYNEELADRIDDLRDTIGTQVTEQRIVREEI